MDHPSISCLRKKSEAYPPDAYKSIEDLLFPCIFLKMLQYKFIKGGFLEWNITMHLGFC